MATALQVFYNLGSLVGTVNQVINKVRENLKNSVQEALDANTLAQVQPNTGIESRATSETSNSVRGNDQNSFLGKFACALQYKSSNNQRLRRCVRPFGKKHKIPPETMHMVDRNNVIRPCIREGGGGGRSVSMNT